MTSKLRIAEGTVSTEISEPIILLLHDGELVDVRAMLDEIGATYVEWIGSPDTSYEQTAWDAVISTDAQMMNLDIGSVGHTPTRIAVLEKDSPTLRSALRRVGVDYMVGRPVHPAALRLLIQHVIYRGPEKRRSKRVSIGVPVHFRCRFRRKPAILADLSVTGCLLRSDYTAVENVNVTVFFPPELGDGKAFKVKGEVHRSGAADTAGGSQSISIRFDQLSPASVARIQKAVERYTEGPALLEQLVADDLPPLEVAERPQPTPESRAEPEGERRHGDRVSFSRRVISLGSASAQVLIGRNLSPTGMLVHPHPNLRVGDDVRVALHARAGREPLVLSARVERGDAETGFGLAFQDVTEAATDYLAEMLGDLPSIEGPEADDVQLVVSELIPAELQPD